MRCCCSVPLLIGIELDLTGAEVHVRIYRADDILILVSALSPAFYVLFPNLRSSQACYAFNLLPIETLELGNCPLAVERYLKDYITHSLRCHIHFPCLLTFSTRARPYHRQSSIHTPTQNRERETIVRTFSNRSTVNSHVYTLDHLLNRPTTGAYIKRIKYASCV